MIINATGIEYGNLEPISDHKDWFFSLPELNMIYESTLSQRVMGETVWPDCFDIESGTPLENTQRAVQEIIKGRMLRIGTRAGLYGWPVNRQPLERQDQAWRRTVHEVFECGAEHLDFYCPVFYPVLKDMSEWKDMVRGMCHMLGGLPHRGVISFYTPFWHESKGGGDVPSETVVEHLDFIREETGADIALWLNSWLGDHRGTWTEMQDLGKLRWVPTVMEWMENEATDSDYDSSLCEGGGAAEA